MLPELPPLPEQAERLIARGVHERAGMSAAELRGAAAAAGGGLLAVHPDRAPASVLGPLMALDGRSGFVVEDMTDLDDFAPVPEAAPPDCAVYRVAGLDRGDGMANWSPNEAMPALTAAGRSPLTVTEGISWVLQQPEALDRNHCFMTIGSRRSKPDGSLDARTPAVWISNGTGRDGAARRNAPKVGWCWAGNRHTWLGFASATRRAPLDFRGS